MWKIAGIESIINRLSIRSERIGLAMSGGGARGFCHVGVFKAFDRYGIRPSIISGVSAGSIAAVLYAAGLDWRQILECFEHTPKFGNFTEFQIPTKGLFKLDKFQRLLESWLPVRNLEQLSVPTVVCATDFDHSKSMGWVRGEIAPRVLASCSIPVVFPPVTIDGVRYVDGGVLRNLPAWAIRNYCDTLIGSNCSPINRRASVKDNILDTALRSFQMMSKANTLQDVKLCDIVVESSNMNDAGTFDLSRMHRLVGIGYEAACTALESKFG